MAKMDSIIEHPVEKVFPSYYSILTAKVRYDKDIPMGAKVCFSEITALTNRSGFCYASNRYFAGLYDVSTTTISTWIRDLKKGGHIYVTDLNGMRKIYITEQAGAFPKKHPNPKSEKAEFAQADALARSRGKQQDDYMKEQTKKFKDDPADQDWIKEQMDETKKGLRKTG